ncbi:MAG: hypothetical protein R2883_01835 [Caldisericia bacterium]
MVTAAEKQLARRPHLMWGVPITLPNYENQSAVFSHLEVYYISNKSQISGTCLDKI